MPTASTSKSNPLTVVAAVKTKEEEEDVRLGRRIKMSYVDPKASGSFGGIQNVRRYGREVKDLARNDAYTPQVGSGTFQQKKDVFEGAWRSISDRFGGPCQHLFA